MVIDLEKFKIAMHSVRARAVSEGRGATYIEALDYVRSVVLGALEQDGHSSEQLLREKIKELESEVKGLQALLDDDNDDKEEFSST